MSEFRLTDGSPFHLEELPGIPGGTDSQDPRHIAVAQGSSKEIVQMTLEIRRASAT